MDSDSVRTPLPSVCSSLPDSLQSHAESLSHTSTNSSMIVESEVSSCYQTDATINLVNFITVSISTSFYQQRECAMFKVTTIGIFSVIQDCG